MIGKTIGKYRIVGQLGRGGMGTVYKAVDESLDREVAIKILNPELADSAILKRFRTEATTLAKLNHPEIATIYELFRCEDGLLMVMEFVQGETLDALSDRIGPLTPERAASVIDRLLSALEHAHRAGIVHRDMKPANVMVTDAGGVKIMDFGIARVRGAEHVTVDGHMMGTPAYMSPEQVLGQEVDGRADLYSVGVMFYRLLTGSLPFKADTAIGMVRKQISETPTPVRTHRADLPEWCETILRRALAKSPADRFQTAEEFRAALSQATGMVAGEQSQVFGTLDRRAPPPQPLRSQARPLMPFEEALPPAGSSNDVPTIVLRTGHFALVALLLLAVLAIGVTILASIALRRSVPATADLVAGPGRGPSVSRPATAGGPTPRRSEPAASSADRSPGTAASSSGPASAALPADALRTAPAVGSALSRAAPVRLFPLAFDARALLLEDGRSRELKSQVVLADGRITVIAKDQGDRLHNLRYDRILSISYSRGRDPLWQSPSGPAPVIHVGRGLFWMFRDDPHWVSLQTPDGFLVMRLDDREQAERAIAALEERTRKAAAIVTEAKDAK